MPGRVEGPASTDGADIARGRDIGFRFRVFLSLTKMEVATVTNLALAATGRAIDGAFMLVADSALAAGQPRALALTAADVTGPTTCAHVRCPPLPVAWALARITLVCCGLCDACVCRCLCVAAGEAQCVSALLSVWRCAAAGCACRVLEQQAVCLRLSCLTNVLHMYMPYPRLGADQENYPERTTPAEDNYPG